MHNMSCPDKYLAIGDFYKYYSGELIAPFLTIFIGGNHEASNYLQELFKKQYKINFKTNCFRYFGGWVAKNIYFLGASGVINIKKGIHQIRVGGISGIFFEKDFFTKSL